MKRSRRSLCCKPVQGPNSVRVNRPAFRHLPISPLMLLSRISLSQGTTRRYGSQATPGASRHILVPTVLYHSESTLGGTRVCLSRASVATRQSASRGDRGQNSRGKQLWPSLFSADRVALANHRSSSCSSPRLSYPHSKHSNRPRNRLPSSSRSLISSTHPLSLPTSAARTGADWRAP